MVSKEIKKIYKVEGVFMVPGYNDFDFDFFRVEAASLEEAKKTRELLRDTYGDEWDFVYYRID